VIRGLFAFGLTLAACAPAAAPPSPIVAGRTDSLAGALYRRFDLPGVSIAVALADGRTWRWQMGSADLATGRRIDRSTVFRAGSVSKMFTAAIAARLVAAGRLDLDLPISRYMPGLPARYGALTARLLAGHLAGVRHYGPGEFENHTHYASVAAALGIFLKDTLLTPPGTRYFYSTYGYNLLGAVLESAAGKSYAALLEDEVARPLKLLRTRLEPDAGPAESQALPYTKGNDGTYQPSHQVDLSDRWPAGGVTSSAEELARFGLGLFTPGYLPDAVRTILLTPQRTIDGKLIAVGLGWRITTDSLGRRYVHHGGASTGGRAFILVYPDQGVAVAILANTEAGFGEAEALAFATQALACRSRDACAPDR
jgi:CubicO group peptidase (beta-lactamase class C family)